MTRSGNKEDKMNRKSLSRTITGAAVGLAMILGITIGTAQAHYRDYDDRGKSDDQGGWSRDRTKDYAFKLGYHQSYSEAADARDRGFRGSFRDMPGYRTDTNGFLNWMGYREDYRDAYRRGYESGFKDAFSGRERRYGRDDVERVLGQRLKDAYPDDEDSYRDRDGRDGRGEYDDRGRWGRGEHDDRGNWGRGNISIIAQQNGYRDAYRHGEQDRQRRVGFDYEHSRQYRDALSGYRSEYGSRDRYRVAYREGYRRGYSEGFRRGDNRRVG